MDDNSVKTMRFVCQQLRHEMDYEVGLSVVLTPESFSNPWLRAISIRSCVIRRMGSIFSLNHITKPEKMERLYFDSEIFMDADLAELVIRKFRRLRQLIMFTEDVEELKNNLDEAVSNGISSAMITRLEQQFPVTALDVKFDTNKWKLKWNVKLKPQLKTWEVRDVVGPFGESGISRIISDPLKKTLKLITISVPFVQERDRLIWLRVLHTQNVLRSLTCDLNATHWKEYERVVRANHATLEKLFLLNITSSPKKNAKPSGAQTESPFDWSMFADCNALADITLIADTFLRSSKTRRYMNSVNLTSLNCPKLRGMWLENFNFSTQEVTFLTQGDNLDSTRFELCTLKNCKLGTNEVLETHVGSRKERSRSLECLCFGTTSYDDEVLNSFEKYTGLDANGHFVDLPRPGGPMDMIEFFQFEKEMGSMTLSEPAAHKDSLGELLMDNANLIGGIVFTAWLAWC